MMTRRHAGQRLTLALPGRPARLVVKLPRARQPGRRGRAGTAANAAVSRDTSPRGSGVPAADWRDQVLTGARQPWQPGPGQPRDPAPAVLPDRHAPGAQASSRTHDHR